MTTPAPKFTSDWLTKQLWQFEKYLTPLAGQPCRLLEIGSYEGRTTCWLLDNIAKHPQASLVCVDIYTQPTFATNIATCGNGDKVTLVLGPSGDRLRTIGPPGSFDFIYIDGGHGTLDVIEDAILSFRLLKVGGVIGFDDYKWKDRTSKEVGRPKAAIDVFLKLYKAKIKILNKGYQVWIRKTEA